MERWANAFEPQTAGEKVIRRMYASTRTLFWLGLFRLHFADFWLWSSHSFLGRLKGIASLILLNRESHRVDTLSQLCWSISSTQRCSSLPSQMPHYTCLDHAVYSIDKPKIDLTFLWRVSNFIVSLQLPCLPSSIILKIQSNFFILTLFWYFFGCTEADKYS